MGVRTDQHALVTMIRIERIELREIILPLADRFRTSAGAVDERRVLLLELHDADGSREWSECVAETLPTYAPDTVDTCWLAISKWIAPIVIGESFESPELVDSALAKRIRGHRMARSAIEMGSWALFCPESGVSFLQRSWTDRKPAPNPSQVKIKNGFHLKLFEPQLCCRTGSCPLRGNPRLNPMPPAELLFRGKKPPILFLGEGKSYSPKKINRP